MAAEPRPFDLRSTRAIFGPEGSVTLKSVTPTFYDELRTQFGRFRGHVLVSEHEFGEAWPTWEVRPNGDELIYLLDGDTDFVLRTGNDENVVRLDRPGTFLVVPRGTWHTARPRQLTRALFFTPGEGTRNAASPDGTVPA